MQNIIMRIIEFKVVFSVHADKIQYLFPAIRKDSPMNVLAALVLGLLIGWLIEWIIDWFYWRARIQASIDENSRLEKENAHLRGNALLEEENAILMREHKKLDEENSSLKEHITQLEDELNQIKASALIAGLLNKDGTHNFQAVKGIGPAFEKRLNEAGIHTFEQLSQLTPQDMEKILGTLYKRFFSKKNTILTQAQEFAKHIATSQGKRKA
jgi:predicted flap endonuclease-1-like 5' DNA nuclease